VVDRGAPLALDHVALGVGCSKDQQPLVKIIGQRRIDRRQPLLAETRAILQHIPADELETVLVVALGAGIELGEAAIGAILREQPIERADHSDIWRRRCLVARSPGIERRQ
jgi:hypothetical protein